MDKKKKNLIYIVIILLLGGGSVFYLYDYFFLSKTPSEGIDINISTQEDVEVDLSFSDIADSSLTPESDKDPLLQGDLKNVSEVSDFDGLGIFEKEKYIKLKKRDLLDYYFEFGKKNIFKNPWNNTIQITQNTQNMMNSSENKQEETGNGATGEIIIRSPEEFEEDTGIPSENLRTEEEAEIPDVDLDF